jgi:hypothetical protein
MHKSFFERAKGSILMAIGSLCGEVLDSQTRIAIATDLNADILNIVEEYLSRKQKPKFQ